jgi:hypothetical protein
MTLEELVEHFSLAYQALQRRYWECCDLANEAKSVYGQQGLTAIASTAGIGIKRVADLARLGALYPANVREQFSDLSFSHFEEAAKARSRFTPGTPESDPIFWLSQAKQHRWTSHDLRRVSRERANPDNPRPELGRAGRVLALAALAERQAAEMRVAVARFNDLLAPFYGARLVLTEEPIESLRQVS